MKKKVEYKDVSKEMVIKRFKDELIDTIAEKYEIKHKYKELYQSGLLDEKIKILAKTIDELEKE